MNTEITMAVYVCKGCGIAFAIPYRFAEEHSHHDILCPNGHRLADGRHVVQQLRIDAESAQDEFDRAYREIDDLRRTVAALRGVITKLKRRNS